MPHNPDNFDAEKCQDLAYEALELAKVHFQDSDVESLAYGIKQAIDSWFGDGRHLISKPPKER